MAPLAIVTPTAALVAEKATVIPALIRVYAAALHMSTAAAAAPDSWGVPVDTQALVLMPTSAACQMFTSIPCSVTAY